MHCYNWPQYFPAGRGAVGLTGSEPVQPVSKGAWTEASSHAELAGIESIHHSQAQPGNLGASRAPPAHHHVIIRPLRMIEESFSMQSDSVLANGMLFLSRVAAGFRDLAARDRQRG
jgi:hypothetical protein